MTPDNSGLVREVEVAVWGELGKRRWFGKHVDDEEFEMLEADLHSAITNALNASPDA